MEGMTYGELAEITGKSEAALRTALHRIKKRIQKEAPHDLAF
jgi:DNA-directed RNA polymerase specialized sigma24 family protein